MSTNVEITKTKAEQDFAAHFDRIADALPTAAVELSDRRAAMARFYEVGLPHRRHEAWKYTDLRNVLRDVHAPAVGDSLKISKAQLDEALGPLAALDVYRATFLNGRFDDEISQLPQMPGVTLSPLSQVGADVSATDDDLEAALASQSIVALNTAFLTDGLAIELADGASIDKPLMIVKARSGDQDLLVTTRHSVTLGKGAVLSLIEVSVSIDGSGGQANSLVMVDVGDGAQLDHVKVGAGASGAVADLATWRAKLSAEARYNAVQFIPGAPLSRNQVFVTFDGEGGALNFASAVLGNGSDHLDSTIVVDHRAPGCESRELFKGVLDGRARAVCQGKVIVQQIAQKTDGKQMAQALMLSEDCEFDSKPELEIYADDVACGHGSTSAEIDQDLIFYCRSRGIPEDLAKVLLTESFVAEAIDLVAHDELREAMTEIARQWLAANHASQ